MRLTIRLPHGHRIATKGGHDPRRRAARQLSTWFTQAAFFGYAMTMWKYGYDLGRVREFAVESGWLAHWQSWAGISVLAQVLGLPLRHYSERASKANRVRPPQFAPIQVPMQAKPPAAAPRAIPPAAPQPIFSVPSSARRPRRSSPAILYRAG